MDTTTPPPTPTAPTPLPTPMAVSRGERSEIENSLMPLLLVIARRARLLVILPLLAALLALVYSKVVDPIYLATARVLPPQYNENTAGSMQGQFGGESQLGNSSLAIKNPTDLFVGILNSRTITDAVIARFELSGRYEETSLYATRRMLRSRTTIRAGNDGIVSVSVEDESPEFAAELTNAMVDEFYAFSGDLARAEDGRRSAYYERALTRAREQLHLADVALAEVEKQTGFTRLAGQDQAIVQAAAELQAEISAREVQRRTMASYATAANPDVRLVESELAELRSELAELRARPGAQILDGLGAAGSDAAFVELGRIPDVLTLHVQRQRDVHYWESIVFLLGRYAELNRLDERRDMSLFQVLDRAVPPEMKAKPRTAVNMILATLAAGIGTLLWVLAAAYVAQRRSRSTDFDDQWGELLATLLAALTGRARS